MDGGSRQTELVDTPLGRYETFADDLTTQQLRRFGANQLADVEIATSLVHPGDVVLDVGAHIGTFSIPLARAVQPGGHVYAFEPVPETLEVLEHNVALNEASVSAVNALVSDSPAAMRRTDVSGNTQGTYFETVPGGEAGDELPTIVLDEFIADADAAGSVGLLKVDVEGMELQVLRGATGVIARDRPAIVAEVNRRHMARVGTSAAELDAFFREHGYHLFLNVAARRRDDDRHTLGRLPALRLLRLGGDSLKLVDVVAVHPESDRYPRDATGPMRTYRALGRAGMRDVKRRAKRLLARQRRSKTALRS